MLEVIIILLLGKIGANCINQRKMVDWANFFKGF